MQSPENMNNQQTKPNREYTDSTQYQQPYPPQMYGGYNNPVQYPQKPIRGYVDPTQYQQPYQGYANPTQYQQQAGTPMPPHPGSYQRPPVKKEQAEQVSPRMSKAEALTVVQRSKKWLIAGSFVAFGIFSGLAASHAVGTASASNQASPTPSKSGSNQASPSDNQNNPGGGYFQDPQQQQQQQGGGYGFGNGSSNLPPVSGSHVS